MDFQNFKEMKPNLEKYYLLGVVWKIIFLLFLVASLWYLLGDTFYCGIGVVCYALFESYRYEHLPKEYKNIFACPKIYYQDIWTILFLFLLFGIDYHLKSCDVMPILRIGNSYMLYILFVGMSFIRWIHRN